MTTTLVSRHFFRRTARRAQAKLRAKGKRAVVVPAARGPFRWEVRVEARKGDE